MKAGQKLYLYKKVMESIHKTPWHMILAPGALVCPKACRDSVILSQEVFLAFFSIASHHSNDFVQEQRRTFMYCQSHYHWHTIGLADHIDKTEAGSCFSAVKEQTCQNCRTLHSSVSSEKFSLSRV